MPITQLKSFKKIKIYKLISVFLSVIIVLSSFLILHASAQAVGQITSATVSISDSRPSQTAVTYTNSFKPATTGTIQCVTIQYTTAAQGSTEPTGMTTASAATGTVSGVTGTWTLYNTVDGTLQYENGTGGTATAGTLATFPTTGSVTNPSSAATFYAKITTYTTLTTHTCSGAVDQITVAWETTSGIAASVTVDPTLTFSVNGVASGATVNSDPQTTTATSTSTTIPFGTVAGNALGVAAHDLTVTTNANGGYTIYAKYTGPLTDGASHTIADASGTNASPATFGASQTVSAFGYTTQSTTLSGTANRFASANYSKFTTTNAEIAGNAGSPGSVNAQTTRVGYKVAISNLQAPGIYTTTVVLTATPTY